MKFNEVNPDCFSVLDELLPYLILISFILGYLFLRNFKVNLKDKNNKKAQNLIFFNNNRTIKDYDDYDKEIN